MRYVVFEQLSDNVGLYRLIYTEALNLIIET